MRERPDLELPERVPEMEHYHDSPMDLLPFALYALSKIDDSRAEAYRQICVTGLEDDRVRLPPRWDFHDESLRAIVRYHVELGRQGEWDPTYFIVSAYADCSTVVLVTLDDDDMECRPDLLWTSMDQSGLLCNDFQIANSSWSEAKEEDLGGPQWFQPGPGDPSATQLDNLNDGPAANPPGHIDYGTAPPVGFHIQLYAVDGTDEDRLLHEIQPGPESQKRDLSQQSCKLQHLSIAEGHDPARDAASLHPSRCLQHPTLQKKYFLIADTPNYTEDGVQVFHVDWDGKLEGRTSEELFEIGQNASIQTQRAEVSAIATRAAVPLTLMIAQGYEDWAPKHKLFAVYAGDSADPDIHISQAVDPHWENRGHGQDRIVFGGFLKAPESEEPRFWRSLLEKHLACCRARKFVPNFMYQYLIWCGEQPVTADSPILLVKLDCEGDLRSLEMLSEHAAGGISTWRATAKDAHGILSDVVEGRKAWSGQSL